MDDPRSLGPYRLLGRFDDDGIATTYLGLAPDRRRVVITSAGTQNAGPALAHRLQTDLQRLWRVPSFCTARVLDADFANDPPYLVREEIRGHTLAQRVQQDGFLSGSALVAFADDLAATLASVHGVQVAHGALAPHKVILGPDGCRLLGFSSPVARTSPDWAGPDIEEFAFTGLETLVAEPGTPAEPSGDVFSWGCLVVYAATGRSPFEANSRSAVLSRLLDGRPDLDDLPQPLRQVVERALTRDPADRPESARLRALTHGAPMPLLQPKPSPGRTGEASERFQRFFTAEIERTTADPPYRAVHVRRGGRRRAVALTATLSLLGGMAGVALIDGDAQSRLRQVLASATSRTTSNAPRATVTSTPSDALARADVRRAQPMAPDGGEPIVQDSLTSPDQWQDSRLPDGSGTCVVRNGMQVTLVRPDGFPCMGSAEEMTDDIGVQVTATLQSAGTCAAVWFHWQRAGGGSVLRLCERQVVAAADRPNGSTAYGQIPLVTPVQLNVATRLHLVLRDRQVYVWRDKAFVGSVRLPGNEPDHGQIQLGVTGTVPGGHPPYRATFKDVDIRSL